MVVTRLDIASFLTEERWKVFSRKHKDPFTQEEIKFFTSSRLIEQDLELQIVLWPDYTDVLINTLMPEPCRLNIQRTFYSEMDKIPFLEWVHWAIRELNLDSEKVFDNLKK
jgi:hypothetical protein